MPHWQKEPPSLEHGLPFRLIRVPPKDTLRGVVTCLDIIGCCTHFLGNRTLPCEGPDECKACADGYAWRWHAYVSLIKSDSLEHVILELTANASDPLRNYARLKQTVRGCYIKANRPSGRPNGRIIVSCKPTDEQRTRLPDPPNVQRILCHIWGVQYKPPSKRTTTRRPAVQLHVDPSDHDARYEPAQLLQPECLKPLPQARPVANARIPPGYRFPGPDDDTPELRKEGLLHDFCTCGHPQFAHTGPEGQANCIQCACLQFAFKCWLVRIPNETPR